jgi:hypothetical protein
MYWSLTAPVLATLVVVSSPVRCCLEAASLHCLPSATVPGPGASIPGAGLPINESAAPVKGCKTVENERRKKRRRRGQPILEPFSAQLLRKLLWLLQRRLFAKRREGGYLRRTERVRRKRKENEGRCCKGGRHDNYAFCRRSRKVETSSSPLGAVMKDGGLVRATGE